MAKKTKDTNQTENQSSDVLTPKKRGLESVLNENENLEKKEEPSLEFLVYGEESDKNILPFPQSDLQTQTKNLVLQYDIQLNKLPQNIVDSVNLFIQDFSVFVTNPMQVNLIGVIMEKDTNSFNLINKWTENKKEMLLELKEKNKIEKKNTELPNNIQQILSEPLQPNTPQPNANENAFPRQPISTYQHNISTPTAPSQLNGVFPTGENKNIHYEILKNASASIIANDTAQQNWKGENPQQEVVIDKEKIFSDYCNSISSLIKSTFQMIHWGYIPLDALKTILNNCDKEYTYEIVNNEDNSFVKMTNKSSKTINSITFNIR